MRSGASATGAASGRTIEAIRALGYTGGKTQVYNHCQRWRQEQANTPRNAGFVPLSFELGEAFQFDWSCEYAFVGGLRRRLEVAHIKLAASRAFLLVAYYSQAHEMLFDAHTAGSRFWAGCPNAASTTTCAPPWTRWARASSAA
jgi:hypothetical protein